MPRKWPGKPGGATLAAMAQSAGSLASVPEGIQAAAGRAGAYALALGLGAILGAWAAGWDCTGADALAFEFLE